MITSKTDREKMRFFLTYAGTSYQPGKETKRRGRWNGAALLTDAEIRMLDSGVLIPIWDIDHDVMSDDWISESEDSERDNGFSNPWHTYQLRLESAETGETVAALGGIDFGRNSWPNDGSEYGNAWSRLYPAELASEHIAEYDAKLSENLADCAAFKLVTDIAERYASPETHTFPSVNESADILAAVARIRQ